LTTRAPSLRFAIAAAGKSAAATFVVGCAAAKSSAAMPRHLQRRSQRLVWIGRGAVDSARVLKPLIPKIGAYGIEIHDEIELEYALAAQP
jgi:hypothetical protein